MTPQEFIDEAADLVNINTHGTIVYQSTIASLFEQSCLPITTDLLMDIVADNIATDHEGGEAIDCQGVRRDVEKSVHSYGP